MDQELLYIELLAEKETIKQKLRKNANRSMLRLLGILGITIFVFISLTAVIHFRINYYGMRYLQLIRSYQAIIVVGGTICIGLLGLMLVIYIRKIRNQQTIDTWLKKQIAQIVDYETIYSDEENYYLATKQARIPKIKLSKANTICITTSLDDEPIMMGTQKIVAGFERVQLFMVTETEKELPFSFKSQMPTQRKALILFVTVGLGVFLLSFAYVKDLYARFDAPLAAEDISGNDWEQADSVGGNSSVASAKQGTAPDYQVSEQMKLEWNQQTDELYMTTDSGQNWQFVPLKPAWLRAGNYMLTSGEIPQGYWMDKSYSLAPDFSWFIFSPDETALYTLQTTDGGENWTQGLVTEHMGRLRYRKASYYKPDSGILVTSSETDMSEEFISIYSTVDHGENWTNIGSTSISQPIQNSSFLSQMMGFIATREQLYYTTNGGSSFKEAIVTLPEDYKKGGLDLFQSPNEIIQTGTNTLEAKFYLLKTGDIDRGKMFACLFRSTDNGETWQFVEELSQVKQTD